MISEVCSHVALRANFPQPLMKWTRIHTVKDIACVRLTGVGATLSNRTREYKTEPRGFSALSKMLRNTAVTRNFNAAQAFCLIFVLFCCTARLRAIPVPTVTVDQDHVTAGGSAENATVNNDLYVIKAIVYEIGILTDTDNSTSESTERQEEVKISFYDRSTDKDEDSTLSKSPIPLVFDARNLTS